MRWFDILNSTAFKEWIIATGSGGTLPQGEFKLDPFGSSMRKFNNAHTWLSELNNTGVFNPSGRESQAKSDLATAGFFIDETIFTILGQMTIDKWDAFGIPAGDDDYEIHRCLLLVNNAISIGDKQYLTYYNRWLNLRKLFEYNFLVTNKSYLYLFSYFDKYSNGYNPFNVITSLKISQAYFDANIDWNLIKNYYIDPAVDTAVDKYESTINTYTGREGRSNICIAYEIISKDEADRIDFISSLTMSQICKDKLIEINENIKPFVNASNKIYYGPPGTGKSYEVNKITKPHRLINPKRVEIVTFHPEYDYHSFVGSYKPTMKNEKISYEFIPQPFAKIYVSAWQNLENEYFLQIEEINRGNCAEIFGDLFQLLDRNPDYNVTADEDFKKYLQSELGIEHKGILDGQISLPPNLNLIATMNTSDQSLFPMDSAFKRRWNWVYVPIKYEEDCNDVSKDYLIELDGLNYKWLTFLEKINKEIFNATESQDKQIGNWFVTPKQGNIIDIETIVNKVIFYLWNDIFKDEDEHNIFKVTDDKASEFGIETDKKVITFEKYFEGEARYRIPILKYLFNEVLSVEPI
ncbi:MAG: AAA family ATPase [Sulfurimonas sp.]|uniref:McrB family protein n=1 Tax=Sulfurimonas sp. TaxID=2022749 RepID=UPI0026329F37|nr:AAA family ATPase [Sulfurimonas sp.]MDD5401109.1 AAA family ATPase [Sulfurimonas sp.]